jgi:hypothetical protein
MLTRDPDQVIAPSAMTEEQLVAAIEKPDERGASGAPALLSDAHFPKCRHRPDPAAWSGDLCEEPVTFRDGGAGVSCYGISSPLVIR